MSKACVLFVDDEPNVRDAIRRTMRERERDWDIVFAGNGEEALDVMAQRRVDVVVTDIAMPVMDGKTLIAQMYEAHPDTVILVLSGHWTAAMSQRQVGPNVGFLAKPISREALDAAIDEAVREARLANFETPPVQPDDMTRAAQPHADESNWIDLSET